MIQIALSVVLSTVEPATPQGPHNGRRGRERSCHDSRETPCTSRCEAPDQLRIDGACISVAMNSSCRSVIRSTEKTRKTSRAIARRSRGPVNTSSLTRAQPSSRGSTSQAWHARTQRYFASQAIRRPSSTSTTVRLKTGLNGPRCTCSRYWRPTDHHDPAFGSSSPTARTH